MLKHFCFLFLSVFLSFNSFSQFNKIIKTQDAIEDLKFLKIHIQDIHLQPDYFTDSKYFFEQFNLLENNLDSIDEISLFDFYALLAPLVNNIKDIHSQIIIPTNKAFQKRRNFQLELKIIDNELFVKKDFTSTIPIGSKILSINEIKTKDIIENLLKKAPSEADSKSTKIRYIEKNFYELFYISYSQTEIYNIEYQFLEDSTVNKNLKVLGLKKSKALKEKNYFQFDYYSEINTAFVKIPSFMKYGNEDFQDYLNFIFSYLKKNKTENLILDFRDNQGGIVEQGKLLLSYLITEPIVYINKTVLKRSKLLDDIIKQKTENTGISARSLITQDMLRISSETYGTYDTISENMVVSNPLNFQGKLYVLINGFSASTTGLISNALKSDNKAVFVGQQPAFTNKGSFGQAINFSLPNSKLEVHLSTYKFISPSDEKNLFIFTPDIVIDDSIDDLKSGNDAALNLIIEIIKTKNSNNIQ